MLDAFGDQSLDRVRRALSSNGIYVTTVPSVRIAHDALRTLVGSPRARLVVVKARSADLDTIAGLVGETKLRPVIDRVVPFDDAVDGMRHLETKRSRGKIVVSLS